MNNGHHNADEFKPVIERDLCVLSSGRAFSPAAMPALTGVVQDVPVLLSPTPGFDKDTTPFSVPQRLRSESPWIQPGVPVAKHMIEHHFAAAPRRNHQ